ncbi:MAG: SDR family NAD(P)-dependent oxidoreductase [Armatimonadaceae bacterium]
MGRLQGKVALITGAGGGIGEATARLFVEEGARVALTDIHSEAVQNVAATLDSSGTNATAFSADLGQEAAAEHVVRETVSRFGGLDILATVAGVRLYHRITDAPAESWREILDANLLATAYCVKFAIPEMQKRGGGSIVTVSSVNGQRPRAGMVQYDATKGAVISLTRALAADHAADGIRVNCVCPGATLTGFHIRRLARARGISLEEAEAELRHAEYPRILLGRQAEPREIAYAILFLASDESSYITGVDLTVDGGRA